jgi:hypothetical protein
MAEQPQFPHDMGYKSILSYQEIFLELLDSFVDQGWVSQLDRESVARIDKSFVASDFGFKEADLVYRLKINGKDVVFYLLFELQSKVDFQMPFRLLQYMLEIWRDELKRIDPKTAKRKDYKLPVIIPLVLYNAAGNWTACRSFKETLDGAELFGEYVLDFKYILIDVLRYPKEILVNLANLIGIVFLLDRQTDFEEFDRRFTQMKPVLENFDELRLKVFGLWYLNFGMRDFSDEERKKVICDFDATKPEEVR